MPCPSVRMSTYKSEAIGAKPTKLAGNIISCNSIKIGALYLTGIIALLQLKRKYIYIVKPASQLKLR